MLGFKPQISGYGSNHSAICVTNNIFWHWLCSFNISWGLHLGRTLFLIHLLVEAEDDNPEVAVQAWRSSSNGTGLELDKNVKHKRSKCSQTFSKVQFVGKQHPYVQFISSMFANNSWGGTSHCYFMLSIILWSFEKKSSLSLFLSIYALTPSLPPFFSRPIVGYSIEEH